MIILENKQFGLGIVLNAEYENDFIEVLSLGEVPAIDREFSAQIRADEKQGILDSISQTDIFSAEGGDVESRIAALLKPRGYEIVTQIQSEESKQREKDDLIVN
jgi:hypothetical protein